MSAQHAPKLKYHKKPILQTTEIFEPLNLSTGDNSF